MRKTIRTTHNGRKFTLISTGYFLDNNKKQEERLLHRIIWIEAFGPIPKGWDVHHIDENKQNNAIGNLELKRHTVHRRDHMVELLKRNPGLRRELSDRLIEARKNCHDWLRTDFGKEWSRNQLAKNREKTRTYTCAHCGIIFQASVIARHKYCSRKCGLRSAYEARKTRLAQRSVALLTTGDYSSPNEYAAYAAIE